MKHSSSAGQEMEPEGSLPHSQETATHLHPDLHESNQNPHFGKNHLLKMSPIFLI
jgi:uncharacterized protein involved in high-affinity Fe2+ transport